MTIALYITPQGRFGIEQAAESSALAAAAAARIEKAFAPSPERGLLHLATADLKTALPPTFAFARALGRRSLPLLCHQAALESGALEPVPAPHGKELSTLALAAPPMKG